MEEPTQQQLEATYGPLAPFSEQKRGDRIRYISADGKEQTGTVVWVQPPFQSIGMKYIVAPDSKGAFLDFVVLGDVIQVEDVTQEEPALARCPYCRQTHQTSQIAQCPLKPR